MATGGEKRDENDRGSDQGKMCFMFCGASPYYFIIPGYSKFFFDNPDVFQFICMVFCST